MKINILALLLLPLIFVSCSSKNAENDRKYKELEQAIMSTKKARLELSDNSTLLLTAVYLNNLKRFSEKEQDSIVLSVYFSPSLQNNQTLGFPKVSINKEEVDVKELKRGDEILNYLPSQNRWSRYYLVSGKDRVSFKKIELSVEIYPFSKESLTLQKDF